MRCEFCVQLFYAKKKNSGSLLIIEISILITDATIAKTKGH